MLQLPLRVLFQKFSSLFLSFNTASLYSHLFKNAFTSVGKIHIYIITHILNILLIQTYRATSAFADAASQISYRLFLLKHFLLPVV